eukprot:g4103.t1
MAENAAPSKTEESMFVSLRMRPLNAKEKSRGEQGSSWKMLPEFNSIAMTQSDGSVSKRDTFTYDHVFGPETKTGEIYDTVVDPIVDSVVRGIHGTVFAYGQTSCGKTYTMQGHGDAPGILQMAVLGIFEKIENSPTREFLLRASYIEIYNEVVRDLLDPKAAVLKIRESRDRGVFVEATEKIVTDFSQILSALRFGDKQRHVGETKMNERSSRSHTIFKLTLESKERTGGDENDVDGAVLVSDLNLVDLAGSENVRHTGAGGERLREAGKINTSLLTLSRIIKALASGTQSHLGFRDSKLTRLLQESLTGKTRTALIACATPSSLYVEETRSTLLFAQRAKTVKTCAEVNEILDDNAMLKRLRRDLKKAKDELELLKARKEDSKTVAELKAREERTLLEKEALEEKLCKVEREKIEAVKKVTNLKRNLMSSDRNLGGTVVDVSQPSRKRPRRRESKRQTWCPGASMGTTSALNDFRREMADVAVAEDEVNDAKIANLDIMALEDVEVEKIEDFLGCQRSEDDARRERTTGLVSENESLSRELQSLRSECDDLREHLKTSERGRKETSAVATSDAVAETLDTMVLQVALEMKKETVEDLRAQLVETVKEVRMEKKIYAERAEELEAARLRAEVGAFETSNELQSNLSTARAEIQTANERVAALESKCADADAAVARTCSLLDEAKIENEALRAELDATRAAKQAESAAIREELVETRRSLEVADSQNSAFRETMEKLDQVAEEKVATANKRHGGAKLGLEILQKHNAKLEAKLADVEATNASLRATCHDLKGTCEELTDLLAARDEATTCMMAEKSAEVMTLREALEKTESSSKSHADYESLQTRCGELEVELARARDAHELVLSSVDDRDIKLQSALNEIAELTLARDNAHAKVDQSSAKSAAAIESATIRATALREQMDEMSSRIVDMSRENASLVERSESAESGLVEATESLSDAKSAVRAMEAEISSLQEKTESLESQLACTSARASEMSAENADLHSKVDSLASQLSTAEANGSLRCEIDALAAAKADLVNKLAKSEERVVALSEEILEASNTASTSTEARVEAIRSRDEALAQIQQLEEEIERISGELTDLNFDVEEKKCEWESQKVRLVENEATLKRRCDDADVKLRDAAARIKKLESVKLTEAQVARMITMKKEWKQLKKEKKAGLWNQKAEVEQQLVSLNEKVAAMSEQKRKYKDTIAKRDTALKQARKMMKQVHAELADAKELKLEFDSLKAELANKSSALEHAEDQLLALHEKGNESEAAAEATANIVRQHKALVERLRGENLSIKTEFQKIDRA